MAKAPLPAPLRLPPAAAAALGRRMRREWRATPLHGLALGFPRLVGLAIRPRDARPADRAAGARLLAGVFELAGEALEVGRGGDPWRRPPPSRRFAAALHAFGWLPDLLTQGEAGAREGLRLWLEWRRAFGRYNDFAWSGPALERRVFNLACAAGELARPTSTGWRGRPAIWSARRKIPAGRPSAPPWPDWSARRSPAHPARRCVAARCRGWRRKRTKQCCRTGCMPAARPSGGSTCCSTS
jgi:hypothetical protein